MSRCGCEAGLRAAAARDVREPRARAGPGPERQVGSWESGAGCGEAGGRDCRPERVRARAGEAPELPGEAGRGVFRGRGTRRHGAPREEVFAGAGAELGAQTCSKGRVLGEQDVLRLEPSPEDL